MRLNWSNHFSTRDTHHCKQTMALYSEENVIIMQLRKLSTRVLEIQTETRRKLGKVKLSEFEQSCVSLLLLVTMST